MADIDSKLFSNGEARLQATSLNGSIASFTIVNASDRTVRIVGNDGDNELRGSFDPNTPETEVLMSHTLKFPIPVGGELRFFFEAT